MAVRGIDKSVEVVSIDDEAELHRLLLAGVDLLLINRVLDFGFDDTEGVNVIAKLHSHDPKLKMMLVSNYPESQAAAVAAGALLGFGKRDLGSAKVKDMLREALSLAGAASEGQRPQKQP